MIDHITIRVNDIEKSKAFYVSVLEAIGMKTVLGSQEEKFWGFGHEKEPEFEIDQANEERPKNTGIHFAFKAENKEAVDAFYNKAIEAGGKDNGAPGLRPEYTPNYYAAFVIDPDGNNVEVCVY